MPLSDHEKRLLAEMEAALTQEDPRLVSTLTGKNRTPQSGRALIGGLVLLAGMAVLLTGLVAKTPVIGVVGFLIALSGLVLVLSNLRAPKVDSKGSTGKAKRKSFGSRLEDRWERRNFDR